jgi:hypothetical protein
MRDLGEDDENTEGSIALIQIKLLEAFGSCRSHRRVDGARGATGTCPRVPQISDHSDRRRTREQRTLTESVATLQ